MDGIMFDHLVALYGKETARQVRPELDALLARWREKLASAASPAVAPAPALSLSEKDALLITYADQVRQAGRTPLGALGEFASRHLVGVVSGIHILPFYPWSSDDGFSVKDYYAVDAGFGTWSDVRQLGSRFDLMFDAVFNHMSAQSEWFASFIKGDPAYQDFFVTVDADCDLSQVIRPRALPLLTEFDMPAGRRRVWTTFSADQVDLNVRNPAVLLALIDVLLFYVSQGARFIRLDAIAFLWKEIGTTCLHLPQTHRTVQLMRRVLDVVAPRTLLITETNVPHVDNLSYFGDGTNEAHLIYNFALPPLVLHSFASGNASKLTRWARSLELPSACVALFNFLASHDGIGLNPARGILTDDEINVLVARTLERGGFISYKHLPDRSQVPYEMNINFLDALADSASEPLASLAARALCAHAMQLAIAGVPGIYFHSLFGSRGDRAGADASGIPRRINRQKLELATLENELARPDSLRSQVFSGLRELLRVRRSSRAFHPCGAQHFAEHDPRLFVVWRTSPADDSGEVRGSAGRTETVLCVHNVSDERVETLLPSVPVATRSHHGQGEVPHQAPEVLFAGAGSALVPEGAQMRFSLAPHSLVWARISAGPPFTGGR